MIGRVQIQKKLNRPGPGPKNCGPDGFYLSLRVYIVFTKIKFLDPDSNLSEVESIYEPGPVAPYHRDCANSFFISILEEYALLMTKYQSEYNRNVDCMIKTDALHEHIRLLSETLAVKEINEEKLTTQQQQMKKLMTLLIPTTSSLAINKKANDKKVIKKKIIIFIYFFFI